MNNHSYLDKSFDEYLTYLRGKRHLFTPGLWSFLTSPDRHGFGAGGLHDGRITGLSLSRESVWGPFRVQLCITGPYRDRRFEFTFSGVTSVFTNLSATGEDQDLLAFEVIALETRSSARAGFIFRAMFPGELLNTEVHCQGIEVEERITGGER